jgi:chromosome partition protein MukB
MQERYDRLTETLEFQEKDFRSDSRDVSNSIRGRINDESKKVIKINKFLDGVSFGNVASIKIEFKRDDGMMNLLDAMQDQASLFSGDIPLTEAMADVYKKITGGQVKGSDLLDYRKYISLSIKILRKGTTKWEPGSVLSTGEAIGAGAAILMVILGSWEETASYFKDRDLRNSMRFLFMDEATRLDPDSINTLLEFCEQMDIQLLIAAPKFEEEECGGGITYRLARRNTKGGEQVIIRGRKGFGGGFIEEAAV